MTTPGEQEDYQSVPFWNQNVEQDSNMTFHVGEESVKATLLHAVQFFGSLTT